MKRFVLFLFIIVFLFSNTVFASDKKIFASNYPLAYFAMRISGDPSMVIFPEIDGDPAFWKPEAEDVTTMQNADVILLNGATYEKWKDMVTLPRKKVVDTSKAFKESYIITKSETTHSHGPSGAHAHAGTAFTTWIDLSQAVLQAEAVKNALIKRGIGNEKELNLNFEALKKELLAIDEEITKITEGKSDMPLVGSHPIYQYFARRYNLNLKKVHWEPDVYPDDELWLELSEVLKDRPAKWMIWEGEPLEKSVSRLKEMGIESAVCDPCGNRPDKGDFMSVMKNNIEELKKIFK